jgi:hypothetical protein
LAYKNFSAIFAQDFFAHCAIGAADHSQPGDHDGQVTENPTFRELPDVIESLNGNLDSASVQASARKWNV